MSISMFSVHHLRVFTHCSQGGNPLAVFWPLEGKNGMIADSDAYASTARSVSWESVFIIPGDAQHQHQLRFFMPNGGEVSMCAHAAIGAAWFLGRTASDLKGTQLLLSTADGILSATYMDNGARICINAKLVESLPLDHSERVACVTACGLGIADLSDDSSLPCLTSSIARPKTILPVRSPESLHSAVPMISERDIANGNVAGWVQLCDSLGSTGLYLYRLSEIGGSGEDGVGNSTGVVIEARQFPRSSGYPEDPATGIAAAALAASLRRRGLLSTNSATVYQGRAMGRCSAIRVSFPASGVLGGDMDDVLEIWGEVSASIENSAPDPSDKASSI